MSMQRRTKSGKAYCGPYRILREKTRGEPDPKPEMTQRPYLERMNLDRMGLMGGDALLAKTIEGEGQ